MTDKDTEFDEGMQGGEVLNVRRFPHIIHAMSKDTRLRIIIVLSLVIGYLIVAVFRSGTAW